MAKPNQKIIDHNLRQLAANLEKALSAIYGEERMAFLLTVTRFDKGGETVDNNADYIGNMGRESSVPMLKELAERLEKNQDIPATQDDEKIQ